MNTFLLIVILLEFAYIVYQDVANRKEREKLGLKIISKDATEYKEVATPVKEEKREEKPNPYIPVEDVPLEKLMGAKDKL